MKTVNNVELRKKRKRNKVLGIIRNNTDVSRYTVKQISNYSMATVLTIVEELLESNYIAEIGTGKSTGGRKPTWLGINPNSAYFIGIDYNASNINGVILNFSKEIVASSTINLVEKKPVTMEKIMREIITCIADLKAKCDQEKIIGIGVGTPGYVNPDDSNIFLSYSHIKDWEGYNIKEKLQAEFNLPVFIENNVNAMTLAHRNLEKESENTDFVLFCIRMGVRMGAITNGSLLKGSSGIAGEIGHMRLTESYRQCSCGKLGCLDAEVSDTSIKAKIAEGIIKGRFEKISEITKNDFSKIEINMLVDLANQNDPDSIYLLKEIGSHIGNSLSYVVGILNPEKIFVIGNVFENNEIVLRETKKYLVENNVFSEIDKLKIVPSPFQQNIGAIGAANLVFDGEFGDIVTN